MVKIGSILVLIALAFIFFGFLATTGLFTNVGKKVLKQKATIAEKAQEEYQHDE